MSAQTKSFVFLILLAIGLAGALFYLTKMKTSPQPDVLQSADQNNLAQEENQQRPEELEPPPTDVDEWQEYTNPELKLSFKHPKNWQVRTAKATDPDLDIIVINPGQNQENLRIYADEENYFAADGLERKDTQIAKQTGWTVEEILYGVKSNTHYFTFDLGSNLRLKPTLKAMMSTVAFQN